MWSVSGRWKWVGSKISQLQKNIIDIEYHHYSFITLQSFLTTLIAQVFHPDLKCQILALNKSMLYTLHLHSYYSTYTQM